MKNYLRLGVILRADGNIISHWTQEDQDIADLLQNRSNNPEYLAFMVAHDWTDSNLAVRWLRNVWTHNYKCAWYFKRMVWFREMTA